jgi:HAD superfamily hydrolase (TIGR01509 family)
MANPPEKFDLPSTPIRAVVFDLDGLLVNTEDLYEKAGNELLGQHGHAMNDGLREQIIGLTAHESFQAMIDTFSLDTTIEELDAESDIIMQQLIADQLEPMPGMLELLTTLEAGRFRRIVATCSRRQYAHELLNACNVAHHFELVLTADDVQRGKPDPEIYELAAQRLELLPTATMVLEDSANGVRAASAAGAYTIAVPNRHTVSHSFKGASLIAESLADPRILIALGLS